MIIYKALAGRIVDDSSNSDHEAHSDENNSPTLHAKDLDGGETMDLDEDTDLNGQDSRHLHVIFEAEVCLDFDWCNH
jgi:hypothetical protein